MTTTTELADAIKIIMEHGCTVFDDCEECPLCKYKGVPGVLGDLCNSILRVK